MSKKVVEGVVERQAIDSEMVKDMPIALGDIKTENGSLLTDVLFDEFPDKKVRVTIEVIED